jgi:hypothetical protein
VTEPTRRHDFIALAVLAAIITVVFADILLGVNVLYIRDILHFHYPTKHVLREIALGGEFPSWNPWLGAGQPMAANPQHEVFYPPTWLILLPNFRVAFHLLVLLHLYIAAFAMYAFLRSLAIRATAAFFGALSFAIGGICLSYLNLLPFLFSVVWLPLTCLYARRYLVSRSWQDFALASFFFAIQLILGEPSTILQTGILLGVFALGAFWACEGPRGAARAVGRVALICIAALLVSAVQMLPTIDHSADSVRAHGFPFEEVAQWSTPPIRFGELLYPNLLGHQGLEGRRFYWASSLYIPRNAPFLATIYPGMLLGVLAIAGIFAGVRGRFLFVAIAIASALLALGAHTPLWRVLYDVGLVRSLRYPEKFLQMGVFTLIVFATLTLDELLAGNERVRRVALRIAIAAAAVAAIATLFTITPLYAPAFASFWNVKGSSVPLMVATSATGWLLAAARGGAVALLVRNVTTTRRAVWLAITAAFVLLDLGMLVFETVPRMPANFYDPPPITRLLPADRQPWRLFHHAAWHGGRREARPYFVPHPDKFWVYRNGIFPLIPAQHDIRMVLDVDFDLTSLTPTAEFQQAATELSAHRRDWADIMASMSNAWYRTRFRDPREAFAEARGDRRDVQPVVILPFAKYPRYFFANRVETIADRADFVRRLAKPTYVKGTALVVGPSFAPAAGRVLHVRETSNTARIEVETAGRAFLVISVTPHKYWSITIDGVETPPIATNIGYQGVVVPAAGNHVVEMRYRNPLFATGGAISVAALLALVLLARRA